MAQQPWWPLTGQEDALRGVQGLCLAGPARAGWGVLSVPLPCCGGCILHPPLHRDRVQPWEPWLLLWALWKAGCSCTCLPSSATHLRPPLELG